MNVRIHTPGLPENFDVAIDDKAAHIVRMSFNPSGKPDVECVKALAAAFITACERIVEANPDAGRHAALAKTGAEEAAMWAVKAATADQS